MDFSTKIVDWYLDHGRKTLPWQGRRSAYRVWLSEVMLQQTQVATVIPYFQMFVRHFPTVKSLATADEEQVLTLWSGLGYYSRARNLHRCAKLIIQLHNGRFPRNSDELQALPGIGRSTAGAILSLAFNKPAAILDGNVKRVLCRFFAVEGWPGHTSIAKQLWQLADNLLPAKNFREYTQGMMDLGALLCTRNPQCSACPLREDCLAFKNDLVAQLPTPKVRKKLPLKATRFLILMDSDNKILLEKRPSSGIWGGLWNAPECAIEQDLARYCQENFFCKPGSIENLADFRHTFSHFQLDIQPMIIRVAPKSNRVLDNSRLIWYAIGQAKQLGLAAPMKKLLGQLSEKFGNGEYAKSELC